MIGRRVCGSDDQTVSTIRDPMISSRQWVVTQSDNGRFFVCDVSRNGTRLTGRRLVPNVKSEIRLAERRWRSTRNLNKWLRIHSSAWGIREFPLQMEWALTSGPVLFSNMGGERPTGLAMIGDVVNCAFRLEKLASEHTGFVLACDRTYAIAGEDFHFREIANIRVKGPENAQMIYTLEGPGARPG